MPNPRSAASLRARLSGPIACELLLASLACVHGGCFRPRVPTATTPTQPAAAQPIAPASNASAIAVAASSEPSLVLAAAGDVNLGRGCGQRLLADPSYDPFRGIAQLWADADLRFVNLESGLSEQHGETQSPHHGLIFTGPPSGADALLRAGVGIVSTANNHAWDYSERGLFETLANLDRVRIAHAGTGHDEEDAYRPAVVHLNGLTVSFFAVTQVWNLGVFADEDARHHVAWADVSRLRAALTRARSESDFVVLSYHGDEEYLDGPLPRTREFVAEVMSLGVDVVLGHHPHVPQGVAWYGARPVFFSLGNFVFDTRATLPWTRASFIAKLRFRRGQPIEVSACPYLIDGFEPIAVPVGNDPRERAFEQHLRSTSASVGGTNLGERDALGCVPLTPPAPSAATKPDRPRRDPLRADRGSVQLGRR
jgi:Bacterial capsule synthesis protein PGA_cap